MIVITQNPDTDFTQQSLCFALPNNAVTNAAVFKHT
jgi:hypothetical protein